MLVPARNGARLGALALSLAVATLSGCGGGGGGGGGGSVTPTPWVLQATNADGLTTYLRAALGPSAVQYFMGVATTGSVTVPMPSANSAAVSFSGTTLQEQGVDEEDLVKSDGVSVFSLDQPAGTQTFPRNVLRRQQLNASAPDAALTPVDSFTVPFSADVRGDGLYLDSDRQQVIAVGKAAGAWGIYDVWFAPQPWSQGATEVAMVRAAAGAPMQTAHRLRIDAQLIGSRRIGATLYLVLRSYPKLPGFDPYWQPANTASNTALLGAMQAQQALPTVSVDGAAPQPLVPPSSCFVQDQNAAKTADIVTIVGIDLATGAQGARCFAGRTEAFYMAPGNVYLATTRSSYATGGSSLIYPAQASTDVHKFALDGLAITYRGSGNVPGHLGFDQNRKSFRLGEYQDMLRVITQMQTGPIAVPIALPPVTTGGTGGGSGSGTAGGGTGSTGSTGTVTSTESPAQLTILQEQAGALVAIGQLPNAARPDPIGKAGELLYASRFVGTRAYVVTYRLIDPLYVLDLSNPADPKVAGQLQVPGYSDYLFPLTDTLLLGVGKDAIADGTLGDGRFAWYQGVQVSLIDASDPAHPVQAARQVIGRRGTTATVLSDHHGIAIQQAGTGARISLPVSVHDTPPPQPTGAPNDYYQFTRTELQRFEIDVTARQLTQLPAVATNVVSPGERSIANDRSLLWGNQVHWYQDGAWRSAPW